MSAARYLFIVGVTFAVLLAADVLNAWAQAGAPTKHGWYTCSYIRAKIAAGNAIAAPKLVVVGGSNALTGIDVRSLADRLSVRAFNFGLAASFGPGFQTFEAAKILKPGDAVLMPFEYMAYDYATPRNSLIDTVYSCGIDYWRTLGWRERIFYVMAAKPFRLFDSLLFRNRDGEMARVAEQAAADAGPLGQGRSSTSTLRVATSEPNLTNHTPLDIRFDPDSAGARAIAGFVAWARQHDVRVFATWPNTLAYAQYRGLKSLSQIRDFYRGLRVPVIGAPADAMFAPALMGDSVYHLNAEGRRVRTLRLADALMTESAFSLWRAAAAKASTAGSSDRPR